MEIYFKFFYIFLSGTSFMLLRSKKLDFKNMMLSAPLSNKYELKDLFKCLKCVPPDLQNLTLS